MSAHHTTSEPVFLDVQELADLLRVSRTSIYRLVERREIAFLRLPRGLRFAKADIDKFLQERRVEKMEKPY